MAMYIDPNRPHEFLQSPNSEVLFEGFHATTYGLHQAGWDLSAHEDFDLHSGYKCIALAGRHPCGLEFITHKTRMDHRDHAMLARDREFLEFHQFRTGTGLGFKFHVARISEKIEWVYHRMPPPAYISAWSESDKFAPIDPTPSTEQRWTLAESSVFRKLKGDVDIYVPNHSVSELLKMIKDKQAPEQKEIRERARKNEMRQKNEIKCQLIAI